jgi:hypothetical protein
VTDRVEQLHTPPAPPHDVALVPGMNRHGAHPQELNAALINVDDVVLPLLRGIGIART